MLKVLRSSSRIESSERVRSPISSPPPGGRGASNRPAAICSAACASRLTRMAISDDTKKPTSTPMAIAIRSARSRSPRSWSKALVSAGGGSARTITAPRTNSLPKIGTAATVTFPGRLAR